MKAIHWITVSIVVLTDNVLVDTATECEKPGDSMVEDNLGN